MYYESCDDIVFNGYRFADDNLFSVQIDSESPPHILATAKNITTSSSMYGRRNIVNSFNREPLTFNLTFTILNNGENESFTEELCSKLYKILDVETYKPLTFSTTDWALDGNGNLSEIEDGGFYYNCIPMVGSESELYLYIKNKGYITIPFVCDAAHGWKKIVQTRRRDAESVGIVWHIDNPCNVKDINGTYRVYPYMKVIIPEGKTYYSIRLKCEYDEQYENGIIDADERKEKTDHMWFTLNGITGNQTIIIDNENQQMYSSAGDNLLSLMPQDNIHFFYLNGGDNIIYHRSLISGEIENNYTTTTFTLAAPYMK